MYELGRFLQHFIYPDIIGLFGLAFALWLRKRKRKVALGISFVSAVLIILPTIPVVPWMMFSIVESKYPVLKSADYPSADAIVVLGGTVGMVVEPRLEAEETGGSRLLPAARLYKNKKAKWIIVAGSAPYEGSDGRTRTHAEDMRDVLIDMGVPAEAILTQDKSRNTEEDIFFSAHLMEKRNLKTALLVTNAFHMKRAMIFGAYTPIKWHPVPTGHEVINVPFSLASFWPSWGHVNMTNRLIKEFFGSHYAQWKLSRRSVATKP